MRKSLIVLIFAIFFCQSYSQNSDFSGHKIFRAVSSDGVNWIRDDFALFEGNSPCAVMDTNQTIFLYYMQDDSMSNTSFLMVRTSTDGEYFSAPQITNISGSVINKIDPSAALLPDGRIKLFYMDNDTVPSQNLYSAVSNDGINFNEEPGIRFSDSIGISSPDVILHGIGCDTNVPKWNVYLSRETKLIRCTSEDGITFSADTNFHWNSGAASGTIIISCGLLKTYFCNDGIWSATSINGILLNPDTLICIAPLENEIVSNPSLIRLLTGEFIMYFNSYSITPIDEHTEFSHTDVLHNYPNPFDEYTTINVPYSALNTSEIFTIRIFNYTGELVRTDFSKGSSYINIERNELSSGMYFYTLQTDSAIIGKGKFVLL